MRILFISSEIEPKYQFDPTYIADNVIPIFYNSSPPSLAEGYQQLLRLARKKSKDVEIQSVGIMCYSHTPYTLSFFQPMLHDVAVSALINDDYELQNKSMNNFINLQEKVFSLEDINSSNEYHGDKNKRSTSYKKLVKFLNSLQGIVSPNDTDAILEVDIISSLVATQGCVLMNSLRVDCEYVNVQTTSIELEDDIDTWVLNVSNRQRHQRYIVDLVDRYFTENILYKYDLMMDSPGGDLARVIHRDYHTFYTNDMLNVAHGINTFRTSLNQDPTMNIFYGFRAKYTNITLLDYAVYRLIDSSPNG